MKSNLKYECEKFILTKKQEKVFPETVETFYHAFDVNEPLEGLSLAKLVYDRNDIKKPYIILDMGLGGCGGYPVFTVGEFSDNAVVRLSYADKYENIIDEKYGETGDFKRGTCKYLGVGLPVLPANPYRYEKYTITQSGKYFSPLIQGQQRFVRIQLDNPGSFVVIEQLYFINTTDTSPHDGYFLCDNEKFNRLWYSSTYTVQMAAIQNSNAWEVVEGWLTPRKLTKADDVGLYKKGGEWDNYTFSCDFKIICNPEIASGAGFAFRALNEKNCFIVFIDSWSRIYIKQRVDAIYKNLYTRQLPIMILCNKTYHMDLTVEGHALDVFIDGDLVIHFEGITSDCGTIGFYQPLEKWAVFRHVRVTSSGETLFADDFDEGLEHWRYRKTKSFLADGGKRDRLPWSGDLDWAGRNSYYAFRNTSYMRGALEMLAFHQTPEGFVYATCYPESIESPDFGNYGYYQSDLFSMWNIVAAADYILFTADKEFAEEIYDSVQKNMDYLFEYVEGDGLFNQRYETSKGLWSHDLEQIGKYAYHNVLLYDTCREAEFIASFLNDEESAQEYNNRAKNIRKAIIEHLYNQSGGYLQVSLTDSQACFMGNALALAVGVVEETEDIKRIISYLDNAEYNVGKIIALAIRGFYNLDENKRAYERMVSPKGGVDWIAALYDHRYPATVWECMVYHREEEMLLGDNWADYSHPDSGLAHILSGYILGIQPTKAGFERFICKPHCYGFEKVSGVVPTVKGNIFCEWEKTHSFRFELEFPDVMTAEICIPVTVENADFYINIGNQQAYDSKTGFTCGFTGKIQPHYVCFTLSGGRYSFVLQQNSTQLS